MTEANARILLRDRGHPRRHQQPGRQGRCREAGLPPAAVLAQVDRMSDAGNSMFPTAANVVQGLAIALIVVVAGHWSLSARTRWLLIMLALIAGMLATLRRQGTL
jgi:hypothetical protein